jgi:signal transduction histidine kinase
MSQKRKPATKILVVDDNPGVLKLLGTLFEEEGMAVTMADSVAAAKAALTAQHWDFDLVLSDIQMPKETGFDLLSWIKRADSPKPDLPVLLTTAQLPEAENRIKGLAMGAVDYVVRPIELSELVIRTMHAIENFKRVRSLEASLQSSEGLANVGRLLAASHHEIKNVATLVYLASTRAAKRFASHSDVEGQNALGALAQAAELLTDISLNVAQLLQPEASPTRPVDLGLLVHDTVTLMQPRIRPHTSNVDAVTGTWAMGHKGRIKQILINLILNAKDAIDELGAPAGGMIRVSVIDKDGCRAIVVKDDGMGFEPAGERTEFQAFSTTKKLRGGQGLGLWLCSTLASNMGGRLTLRSDGVGEGAEAILLLPMASAPDEMDVQSYFMDMDDD